jgi:arylsulfatase A-like enzyme
MFRTVFGGLSWDAHADGRRLPTTLEDYRLSLAPALDQALAALLDDLIETGLFNDVMVVVGGEMGRTPCINARGGRDHWTGCWSTLLAGGGIRGGAVLGASDRIASEPRDRPVHPADLLATQAWVLGIDPQSPMPSANGESACWLNADPLTELLEGPAAIAGIRYRPYTHRRNGTASKA